MDGEDPGQGEDDYGVEGEGDGEDAYYQEMEGQEMDLAEGRMS